MDGATKPRQQWVQGERGRERRWGRDIEEREKEKGGVNICRRETKSRRKSRDVK